MSASNAVAGASPVSRRGTRTQRSAWSLVTGVLMSAATVGSAFFSTPFLLNALGAGRFGAYKVLSDWIAYLPLFEFGLSGSIMAIVAPALGRGDTNQVKQALAAGLRAYLWVTALVIAMGLAFVFAVPYMRFFQGLAPAEIRLAALVLLIPSAWLPLSVFRGLTEALQRGYVVNVLLAVQAFATNVMLVLAANAGWGLVGLGWATVAAQAPTVLALAWLGLRMYPDTLRMRAAPWASRRLWELNWPFFLYGVSTRLGLLSDNLVVGWVLGPAAVAPFFLTQRLITLAQTHVQFIANATWAGLVELYAQQEFETFHARLLDLTVLTSASAVAILGPIAAFNSFFLHRWVGDAGYAGPAVTLLACFNTWLLTIFGLWGWPVSGAGHLGMWVPYAFAFTAVNVAVSIIATMWIGITGPLIGTTVAFLAVTAWALPRVLRQCFRSSPASLWMAALKPLAWGVPYGLLVHLIAQRTAPRTWFDLAWQISLAGIGSFSCWWFLGLSASGRTAWSGRLRAALGL